MVFEVGWSRKEFFLFREIRNICENKFQFREISQNLVEKILLFSKILAASASQYTVEKCTGINGQAFVFFKARF
jgi:hypothetical protein